MILSINLNLIFVAFQQYLLVFLLRQNYNNFYLNLDFRVSNIRKNLQKFEQAYLSILRTNKKELGPYLISMSRSRYPENRGKIGVRLFKKYF